MSRLPVRTELVVGAAVASYTALFGAVAGLVWATLAPRPNPLRAYFVRPSASHTLMGLDVWFAGVALVAGVLCALVTWAVLRWLAYGPGPVLGLAVGGVLGALMADRVGYLAQGTGTVEALGRLEVLRRAGPGYLGQLASLVDFRVHSSGVLLIWPAAAVIVLGVVILLSRPIPGPEPDRSGGQRR